MQTSTSEEIEVGPMAIRFLIEGEQSGGSVAVFEFDVPAGTVLPAAHSHDGYEETIYGLEGVMTWTVDGNATEIAPGDTLCIPRGAVHQFDNPHDTDAKTLAIVTPGILGPDYFREVAAILDAAGDGPPDYAALGKVMNKHGLTCAE
jgi:quercetin dioxygenase-like cupin family protein